MQKILGYTLAISGSTAIDVPTGSTALKADTVVEVSETMKIWFLVPDTEAPTEPRTFKVVSTDEEITDNLVNLEFVSTCVDFSGITHWHVFEVV